MKTTRRPRKAAWLAMLAALALGAAACSSGSAQAEVSTSPPTSDTTTTTEATTTTASTAPTTSATTEQDVEAAVRAAHTRFMVDYFNRDERIDGPEVHLELAREIMTGVVLTRTEESAQRRIAAGERIVGPGFESHIHRVEITDKSARVLDCSRGQASLYSTDGQLIGTPEGDYNYRETWLILEDGQWLIEEFLTGGDVPCDPDEPSF